MVNNINAELENVGLLAAQMFQKVRSANTDGVAGLSKDELSSIDMSDNSVGAAFLKTLNERFDSLDKDENGQLTAKEVTPAKLFGEGLGVPPGLNIASANTDKLTDSDKSGNFFGKANDFVGKLLNTYKNSGGFSALSSSLSVLT